MLVDEVIIPDSVKHIKQYAFYGYGRLKSITIPNSVISIGCSAFMSCNGLAKVNIENIEAWLKIDFDDEYSNPLFYANKLYLNNDLVTDLNIPYGITKINSFVFISCKCLVKVTIPNSVTSIEDSAFAYCSGILSITIPDSVTSISDEAFINVINITYSANMRASGSPWNAKFVNKYIEGYLLYNDSSKVELLACSSAATGCVNIPDSVMSIEDSAFDNCSRLTTVNIPDSVTSIGYSAFNRVNNITYSNNMKATGSPWAAKCVNKYVDDYFVYNDSSKTELLACSTALKGSLDISNSVIVIGDRAFWGCNELTELTIPDSVTNIGAGAFGYCTGLTSLTMSNKVTYIGDQAFYKCTNLDRFNITSIEAWCNVFFEPPAYLSYNYSNPLYYAHKLYLNNELVTDLVIPEGTKAIVGHAFNYCTSIKNLTISNSVISVGAEAFEGCTELTDVTIENGVKELGISVFYGCTSLTNITIPYSITDVGYLAFYDTGYYNNSVNWENGVLYISGLLISADQSLSECYIIKQNTLVIADSAFKDCEELRNVSFPDSLTSIGYSAFENCVGLTQITIPKKVVNIGAYAFYNTGYENNINNWKDDALYIGNNLIRVRGSKNGYYSINPNTCVVAGEAFYDCISLTGVSIPDSVTNIGKNAFYNCTGCTTLELPSLADNAELAGENSIPSLKNLTINMSKNDVLECRSNDILSKSKNTLESITVNGSSYSVGNEFLKNYSALNDITLSSGVQSIGADSFVGTAYYNNNDNWSDGCLYIGCNLIKGDKSSVPSSLNISQSTEVIADAAFEGCDNLESVIIPDLLDRIPSKCFSNCKNLSKVVLGNNVSEIADDAFENCKINELTVGNSITSLPSKIYNSNDLKKINVGNGIKSIGAKAFYNYRNLESVSLPTTVTNVGDSAFYNCKNLNYINIPNGITNIRNNTFNGCNSLTSISLPSSLKSIGNYAFDDCSSLTSVIIPDSIIGIGEGAFKGCSSITGISIPSGVSSIKKWTFAYCSSLNSINIPDSVTSIESNAFDGCSNLRSISLPDNIYKIENYTFSGCTNLRSISIPENVISIGNCAFNKCSSLTNIEIPDKVVAIGAKAFANCTGLTEITIPRSVTSIGDDAFKNTSASFVIYGYSGTVAETYAKENNIRFVDISIKPVSAEIISLPDKLSYNVGETLDISGMKLRVNYSDGSSKEVTENIECKTTVLTSSGTQNITVSYMNVCVGFSVSVTDQSINKAAFVCSNVKATPGSTVVVPILVKNNPGIIAAKTGIKYDTNKLTLLSVKDNDLFGQGTASFDNNTSATPYWITWEDYSAFGNYNNDGTVVFVTFRVKDNAELGMTPITIIVDNQSTYNIDLDNVDFVSVGGSVDIDPRVCGDVDGDGEVTLKDVVVLKRYISENNSETINKANSDVNNDGQINLKDVVLLKRYLAGGWGIDLI